MGLNTICFTILRIEENFQHMNPLPSIDSVNNGSSWVMVINSNRGIEFFMLSER
jgi:hypothetical protein